MKKQMNLGGLVVAAQILGIPGAFAGPWEDGMAAYNRGDYVPELRVLIRPSLQDAPIGASCSVHRRETPLICKGLLTSGFRLRGGNGAAQLRCHRQLPDFLPHVFSNLG